MGWCSCGIGVLVATHARRHPPDKQSAGLERGRKPRPSRPSATAASVTRKVNSSGNVCFAGTNYRVGSKYRRRQVQVAVVGDSVEISIGSELIRSHAVRHDRTREHGALANPGGRPKRINAAWGFVSGSCRGRAVRRVPGLDRSPSGVTNENQPHEVRRGRSSPGDEDAHAEPEPPVVTTEFNRAIDEAAALGRKGEAWAALARLQDVDIEDVVARLIAEDVRDLGPADRDEAVAHAVTALYEEWANNKPVLSVLGFLKVAARNRASTLRATRPQAEDGADPAAVDSAPDLDDLDDDPVARRHRAVAVARQLLPKLGQASLIETMSLFLDRVEAGDDASPTVIAEALDKPYSTVTTHLARGLDRLRHRLQDADLDALLEDNDDDFEEEDL